MFHIFGIVGFKGHALLDIYSWVMGRNRILNFKEVFTVFSSGGDACFWHRAEISARVKDHQVVTIKPEPSTTARLIACVASER